MVAIQRPSSQSKTPRWVVWCGIAVATIILFTFFSADPVSEQLRKQASGESKPQTVSIVAADEVPGDSEHLSHRPKQCRYTSLTDLTPEELHPEEGPRHMITPPKGGKITLVCCQTTAGNLNIAVHHKWAPIGAGRFIEMVEKKYFSATVPMMRCLKNFLCQFGLSGDPATTKLYRKSMDDDPNWLPEGKAHKQNEKGVRRFAKGYLAYAGAGPNSRGQQFIVSLNNVGPLAGGSPWEVPWGELVGEHSFETLDKFYTGYGEKGPTQGYIGKQGVTSEVRENFPKLDYINACEILDETTQDES